MPYCVLEKGEMRHFPKEKAALAVVVSSIILFAFMFLVTTNNIANVSAVEANGVGVYWDSHCTDTLSSIDWGTLIPGSVKNVVVYIRNEVEEPLYLIMSTTNWNPPKASQYMTLLWDYSGQRINSSEALQTTLALSVSRNIEEISSFSFDILLTGSDSLMGDINGDGKVDSVDLVFYFASAYRSQIGDENYNPDADFDDSGTVDSIDLAVYLAPNYGKSWSD
jgi:hypothetical protein